MSMSSYFALSILNNKYVLVGLLGSGAFGAAAAEYVHVLGGRVHERRLKIDKWTFNTRSPARHDRSRRQGKNLDFGNMCHGTPGSKVEHA